MVYSLIAAARRGADGQGDPEITGRVALLLKSLEGDRSAVIVALQKVQAEFGYIPSPAFNEIARWLKVSPSEVYGAATFYAQFYLTPRAAHQIKLCCGTACHVKGVQQVVEAVEDELKLGGQEMTADKRFSVERVACFGACALAPIMVIDEEVYGRMTPNKARQVLGEVH